jgi:hypothetical protein
VLIMLLGSFSIYCVQSSMQSGSVAPDAHAQSSGGGTCCTAAPQTFVPLIEGDVTSCSGLAHTAPIDVHAYTELVLYVGGSSLDFAAEFRPTPTSSVFGFTNQNVMQGGRIRVDGSDFRLTWDCSQLPDGPTHYVVAGVQ